MERRRYDLAAYILFQFIGGILIFMLFWTLMNEITVAFYDLAIADGGANRAQGAEWMKFTWTFAPAIMLTMVALNLISRAVFESRGGAA